MSGFGQLVGTFSWPGHLVVLGRTRGGRGGRRAGRGRRERRWWRVEPGVDGRRRRRGSEPGLAAQADHQLLLGLAAGRRLLVAVDRRRDQNGPRRAREDRVALVVVRIGRRRGRGLNE